MIDSGTLTPPLTALKFAHTDRLGSVMAVTDSTGAVTERFSYNAFGVSNSSAAGYPFRFTGQRLDPETGLMFYKARVYSTVLGRFLQTDPIGTKDDLNLYAYVGNDPLNKTDPSGMSAWTKLGKFVWNGGDVGMTLHGVYEDFDTLSNSQASSFDRGLAVVSLASEFLPISVRDAREGVELVDKGIDQLRRQCCFVAGTLVASENGSTPIELLAVGDRVWSRDEISGETALKPVTAIIPKHDRVIWTVTLSVPAQALGGRDKEIVYQTTDDHPWRLETGVWVETAGLARGMRIRRADGVSADIVSIRNTGKLGAVYNLEVADFHTYFVGKERVWVHNACLASKYLQGGSGYKSFDAFKSANGSARAGHGLHHIVEQRNAGRFGAESVHHTNNVAEVEIGVHDRISAYYSSIQPFSGGLTVRKWLDGQSFDQQYEFGVKTLNDFNRMR